MMTSAAGSKNTIVPKSSIYVSKSHVNCHVFIDFDGTIVPGDATDMLFSGFCDPAWLEIEADWKAGRIGSRECMARQVDLIRATPEDYDALLETVDVDPAFPAFVELCRSRGIAMTVVSDGLDRTIAAVLRRAGIDLPFFANRLDYLGDKRWRLSFPNSRSDCRSLSGNCKCQFPEAARGSVHVMIGDGRSDFCVAGRVDLVVSKSALTQHCDQTGLPHHPVSGFAEIIDLFVGWLGEERLCKGKVFEQLEGAAK
jgi:2-hydroxy-3-keto-5-methylthiopentenyl-1-phosphate phosphatase